MDFELSSDQLALSEAAVALLGDLASPARVRHHTTTDDLYDATLWSALVDQGWTSLTVPADRGGLGLGLVELAVLAEALGAHAAPAPFLSTALALLALDDGAPDLVDALVEQGAVAAVAWAADPAAVTAVAGADGGWRLSGHVPPVVDGPAARVVVVPAVAADGPGLYVVDVDGEAGPRIEREPAMDVTRSLGWLPLEDRPARRFGEATAVTRLEDAAAALGATALLGGSSSALALAVEHAREREQFGRPIGSFQAVKHRCADMLVDVEGMRSASYWAAWCVGAADEDASVSASTAKLWAAEASRRVMASALQVHGGIGFTWEHDLHFFMKRAQLDQWAHGDAAHHRARLGRLLAERVAAGRSVL